MSDARWRRRNKDSRKCIHCNEWAFYDEELGRRLTLCIRHLEIQRKLSQKYREMLKEKQDAK